MPKIGPARLDRSRSYGEVVGFGDCRYEQDGKEFDGQGRELLPDDAKVEHVKTFEVDTENMSKTIVDTPPAQTDAADEPPIHDDLSDMTMAQLRATYTAETGQKVKVKAGMNKAAVAAMIRDARVSRAA